MLNCSNTTHRRLAQAMQVAMHIPDGDALVFLIGKGNERSNLDALETWVKETLPAFDDEYGKVVLPFLIDRLEQTLSCWGNA